MTVIYTWYILKPGFGATWFELLRADVSRCEQSPQTELGWGHHGHSAWHQVFVAHRVRHSPTSRRFTSNILNSRSRTFGDGISLTLNKLPCMTHQPRLEPQRNRQQGRQSISCRYEVKLSAPSNKGRAIDWNSPVYSSTSRTKHFAHMLIIFRWSRYGSVPRTTDVFVVGERCTTP